MLYARFKFALQSFWKETKGAITVETVIAVPLLFWAITATFEYFEVHRYKSAREKATYTIADMISRETAEPGVTSIYMDNALTLFNEMSNDDGTNQIRVSIIRYDANADIYEINWSEVRGEGTLVPLTTNDVRNDHDVLPILDNGEDLILVESLSIYDPVFDVGLNDLIIDTRTFTSIRFASQMCFEGNSCGPQD